eukprot:225020-Rhodomonas_salina.1
MEDNRDGLSKTKTEIRYTTVGVRVFSEPLLDHAAFLPPSLPISGSRMMRTVGHTATATQRDELAKVSARVASVKDCLGAELGQISFLVRKVEFCSCCFLSVKPNHTFLRMDCAMQ